MGLSSVKLHTSNLIDQIWLVDTKGLVVKGRIGDAAGLAEHKVTLWTIRAAKLES